MMGKEISTGEIFEAECAVRTALLAADVKLDIVTASALLSIAIDHFADRSPVGLFEVLNDLYSYAVLAWRSGDLCRACRTELQAGICSWCSQGGRS